MLSLGAAEEDREEENGVGKNNGVQDTFVWESCKRQYYDFGDLKGADSICETIGEEMVPLCLLILISLRTCTPLYYKFP